MRNIIFLVVLCLMAVGSVSMADTFGTGDNQFTIDFVTISGSTNPTSGIPAGSGFFFTGVNNDYRIGKYEISNGQWAKFRANIAPTLVTGYPSKAYDSDPYFTGLNFPTNYVSWYEAAQFVNYLNTSTGHTAAYKFTGTQGTSNYFLGVWASGDIGYNVSNPYRNSNAVYFLPTENEWVKAAYWNGTSLQTYASVGDVAPTQSGWNFYDNGFVTDPGGPWDVGSGSQELNGTFDMMGNVLEWMESPYFSGDYLPDSGRSFRGGVFKGDVYSLASSVRGGNTPLYESYFGFRVASVPEPCSLLLLSLGGLALRHRKR